MLYLTCEKSICDRTYALVIDDVATCEGIGCTSIHFATCVSVGNPCMPRYRRPFQYPIRSLIVRFYKVTEPYWVEVIKAPCVNFSVRVIFNLTKVPVRMFESQPYLTGVTTVFAIMTNWENNAPQEIGLVTPTPQNCVKNCPIARSPIAQLRLCLSNLKGSDNLSCWLIGLVYFKIRRLNTDWNGPWALNLGKTHVALQMIPQHNTYACVFAQPVYFLFTSILAILS